MIEKMYALIFCLVVAICSLCMSPLRVKAGDATAAQFGVVTLTYEHVSSLCANNCERELVVFVHGVGGARDTWENPDTHTYWPSLISADPDLKDFDIVRIDYDSRRFSGASIEEVTKDVDKAMRSLNTQNYRTVQFIAHSLGGLLVRRYLDAAVSSYGHKYASRYRMVLMLGTPGNGSALSNIARLVSSNKQLRALGSIKENDWLQMVNETYIYTLKKRMTTQCSSLYVAAAAEGKKAYGVTIVVDEDSAQVGASDFKTFQDKDHFSLVKPGSAKDAVYLWAKDLMLKCAQGSLCPGPHRSSMSAECGDAEDLAR